MSNNSQIYAITAEKIGQTLTGQKFWHVLYTMLPVVIHVSLMKKASSLQKTNPEVCFTVVGV